jgi:hypothetical protein
MCGMQPHDQHQTRRRPLADVFGSSLWGVFSSSATTTRRPQPLPDAINARRGR